MSKMSKMTMSVLGWMLAAGLVTQPALAEYRPGVGPISLGGAKPLAVDLAKSLPSASDFKGKSGLAALGGSYEIQLVGTKFAAVFDPAGEPVAVFDLSLNHLGWKEIILGGIGFGDLTLWKLVKLFRKAKRDGRDGNELEPQPVDPQDSDDGMPDAGDGAEPTREQALERGMDVMSKLRFTEEWAARNGVPDNRDDGEGVPFQLANFTLGEVQYPNAQFKGKVLEPFLKLAQVLYPEEEWTDESLQEFASEFEFRFDPKKPGYDVVWNQGTRRPKKPPHLPGIVVNYVNPWQNLIYKHNLHEIQRYGEVMIRYFGVYGMIIDFVVSRICQNLTERLDYHENELLALLEASERFEYSANYPTGLIDGTVNALYMNKYAGVNDPNIINGMNKRKLALMYQEKARGKTRTRLAEMAVKRGLKIDEIGGAKFAVVRSTKHETEGQFKGIYSLAIKPYWPIKALSLHVNAKTPAFKIVERYAWDLAGFAARVLIPNNIAFRIWKISVSIRLEPHQKDDFVRARMIRETNREGELSGLVDEALAGRLTLPLSSDELAFTRKSLRQTLINPWKLELDEEPGVVAKNLKMLKERIGSAGASSYFTAERMVPVSP